MLNKFKKKSFHYQTLSTLVLSIFLVTNVFGGVLAFPRAARAQGGPSFTIGDIPRLLGQAYDKVKSYAGATIYQSIVNSTQYFFQKLAYDTATWIASGGPGQQPFLFTEHWGQYLRETALDTTANFIGSLSSPWENLGFNLCTPPDISVVAKIQLGIAQKIQPPGVTPKCAWKDIRKNYEAFAGSVTSGEFLTQVGVMFDPGQSDLSAAFEINNIAILKAEEQKIAAKLEREEGKGFKAVKDFISGNIQTPAAMVQKKMDMFAEAGIKDQEMMLLALPEPKELFEAGAWSIGALFVNTLASQLLKKISGGFYSVKDLVKNRDLVKELETGGAGKVVKTGRASAELAFADLLTPKIFETTNLNFLTEFSTCPPNRGANNCVIDQQFAYAVQQAAAGAPLTVQEAIDKGFLHGDWFLQSPESVLNQEPSCFQEAYCYANLVKLRKARILPIGWELAAAKIGIEIPTSATGKTTVRKSRLSHIVNQFNNCNAQGEADATHPWCHLIDPNWVLKAPLHQCRLKGPGATLLSKDGPVREEVCVDTPSCLAEDENGNCSVGEWGYCTREKNIWRLGGTSCPSQYNTCQTYANAEGNELSLLTNTVDFGVCAAENVGCEWLSKNKSGGNWNDRDASGKKLDRIYFDRDARECAREAAGCGELIRKLPGIGTNLVKNSSFEIDANSNDVPDFWYNAGDPPYPNSGQALFGSQALLLKNGSSNTMDSRVNIATSTTYTISLYTKLDSRAEEGDAIVTLKIYEGAAVKNLSAAASNCPNQNNLAAGEVGFTLRPGPEYERKSCSLTTPTGSVPLTAQVIISASGGDLWFDGVQLEEGLGATDYRESGYGSAARTAFIKRPPDYLGCGTATAPPECRNYAAPCVADEVGCERYSPVTGDSPIPGLAVRENTCPAECVGYAAYKQAATVFELEKPSFDYFISATARACGAESVGCDEFTNLDTAAAGGEAREYFTDLRLCQKPAGDSETFYTWEGSDTTGYQLKVWDLKESDRASTADPTPAADSSDPSDGTGPCTKLATGGTACLDDGVVGVCTQADLATNPDCREFYDKDGNIHRRLLSKTIISTNDCHPYRKTDSNSIFCPRGGGVWNAATSECVYNATAPLSAKCSPAANGCRAYRGNTGGNVRVLFRSDFEGGLQGWEGLASAESINVGGHSLRIQGHTRRDSKKDVSSTSAAPVRQGKTYTLTFWAKGRGNAVAASFETAAFNLVPNSKFAQAATLTPDWQFYSFGPLILDWQTGDEPKWFKFSGFDASADSYLDNIILKESTENITVIKNSWATPRSCDTTLDGGVLPRAMLGCNAYTARDGATFYLTGFTKLCREQAVGCRAFIDTQNTPSQGAETFNAVCTLASGAVGPAACPATGNKVCDVRTGEKSCRYNTAGVAPADDIKADTVVVPADRVVYLVDDGRSGCAPADAGCTLYGAPNEGVCTLAGAATGPARCFVDPDGAAGPIESQNVCEVKSGETSCVYRLPQYIAAGSGINYKEKVVQNLPRDYGATLCVDEAVGCAEWKKLGSREQSTAYFKNPGNQLCEYRENIIIGSQSFSGWFKKGFATPEPCYPNFVIRNDFYGIWRNADATYRGWVGGCPAEQSGCTEFIDPSDISPQTPKGKPYYALKNDKLDQSSCGTRVGQRDGCVLFRDASAPVLKFASGATYLKSKYDANYRLTDAIDCAQAQGGGDCAKQCTKDGGTTFTGRYCRSSGDCNSGETCAAISATAAKVNDSNTIIKVVRDRVCGEWLNCKTSTLTRAWDPSANRYRAICESLTRFIGANRPAPPTAEEPLSEEKYIGRDLSWGGMEYTGYSVPGQYPVEYLDQTIVSGFVANASFSRLGYASCPNSGALNCNTGTPSTKDCVTNNASCGVKYCEKSGKKCSSVSDCGSGENCEETGKCEFGVCVHAIDGKTPKWRTANEFILTDNFPDQTCRIYPETESPFPDKILDPQVPSATGVANADKARSGSFKLANVCEDGGTACECAYQKVEYGDGFVNRYFRQTNSLVPTGICQGGPNAGKTCDPVSSTSKTATGLFMRTGGVDNVCDADAGGQCVPKRRVSQSFGLKGYCLERDKGVNINGQKDEFACLTWLPLDQLAGGIDIYHQNAAAGFQSPGGEDLYYCQQAEGNYNYDLKLRDDKSPPPKVGENILIKFSGLTGQVIRLAPVACAAAAINLALMPGCIAAMGVDAIRASENTAYSAGEEPETSFFKTAGNAPCCSVDYQGLSLKTQGGYKHDYTGPELFKHQIAGFRIDTADMDDNTFAVPDSFYLLPVHGWKNAFRFNQKGKTPGPLISPLRGEPEKFEECQNFYTNSNEKTCSDREEKDGKNCVGMRADFDASGKFVGFTSGMCMNTLGLLQGDSDLPVTRVTALLREPCSELAKVHNTAASTAKNYAWTDRLWRENKPSYEVQPNSYRYDTYGIVSKPINPDFVPFGHAGHVSEVPFRGTEPVLVATEEPGGPYTNLVFNLNQLIPGQENFDEIGTAGDTSNPNFSNVVLHNIPRFLAGLPYSCVGNCNNASLNSTGGRGKTRLQELFARTFNIYKFKFTSPAGYEDNLGWDNTIVGVPPVIKAVNTTDCETTSGVTRCKEGAEGAINVGGQTSGDIVINSGSSLEAKFFFYANENQMPVRYVRIDWGDKTAPPLSSIGSWQNYRGYKDTKNAVSECDNSDFGRSSGACTSDGPYIQRNEAYIFDPSKAECQIKPDTHNDGNDPIDKDHCHFQVKVQVKDNWGWCNGTCPGAPNGGCFDAMKDGTSGSNACLSNNAWTEYDGTIVVTP